MRIVVMIGIFIEKKSPGAWGGGGGAFSSALFHPVGRALPHTSTPQDSPHNPAPKDIQTRYILTGKFYSNMQRQCRTETASGL